MKTTKTTIILIILLIIEIIFGTGYLMGFNKGIEEGKNIWRSDTNANITNKETMA